MQLKLLNIDAFVQRNRLRPVTSGKYQVGSKKIDPEGLFSEEIFGRIATDERKKRFGYVNLKTNIIHPEAWSLVCGINTVISKLLNKKATYTITENGDLIQSDTGNNGVSYFISIFDQINFDKFKNKQKVEFLKKHKNEIIINKLLILPAGIRDIQIGKGTDYIRMESSEINKLYTKLISQTHSIPDEMDAMPEELLNTMVQNIQRTCLDINQWIKDRMKGKRGVLRGGSLNKPTDYSCRMVIIPDPSLEIGDVGMPWQIALKLFEPFTIHYIIKKDEKLYDNIREFLKTDTGLDSDSIKRFLARINENTNIIPNDLKNQLIAAAETIVKDKVVTYKRDPVENRDSWVSAYIRIESEGYVLKINPVDCGRNGADFDGDTMAVFPVFSKEATQEAKEKMNPKHNKGNWITAMNADSFGYPIELDAAATIYMATSN